MTTTTNMAFKGLNKETSEVMKAIAGVKTPEQKVAEFFGLRKEVIYDDSGENVLDVINEFKDLEVLKKKNVSYRERLGEIGVTEEQFNSLFPNGLPDVKGSDAEQSSGTTGTTDSGEGKKVSTRKPRTTKKKSTVSGTKKGTRKTTK